MAGSLRLLTELLEKQHGEKVVVLIDEYDAPVTRASDDEVRRQILDFMRSVLSLLLKGNRSIQMAVLTGITQISKESIFSGLNNLVVDNILSTDCDEMFGFTEEEVKKICSDYGHPEKFEEAKDWYDGCRFGNADICNPWSIPNYVKAGFKAGPYWVNTSGNDVVKNALLHTSDERVFKDMETLASGGSVYSSISMTPAFDDLYRSSKGIYTLLAATGYLSAVEEGKMHRLSIPNRELSTVFSTEILEASGVKEDDALEFADAVLSCDTARMETSLRNLMTETVSIRVLSDERSYQMFVAGLLMCLQGRHHITADFESGDGCRDIRMERISGIGANVVVEFKKARSENDLAHLANDALEQTRDRRCVGGLEGTTVLYGIAFFKKAPRIVSEVLHRAIRDRCRCNRIDVREWISSCA